jgi:hypothetical protein
MASSTEERQIAFKHTLDIYGARSDRQWFEEPYGAKHVTAAPDVWAQKPPFNDPASAVSQGLAIQEVNFVLTLDPFSAGRLWVAKSSPGSWPYTGPQTDWTVLDAQRVRNWISPIVFGLGYSFILKQGNGALIPTGNWEWHFSEGLLHLDDGFSAADMGWVTPLKLTCYRYTGSFLSGATGGVKVYALESALLTAVDPPGTIGYAQDTGNFFFRRAATWQTIPNPQVVRRVTGKYHITVDPVNGDDAEWNDGTVTPLKTLEALFQRLPKAQQTTSGGAAFATDESISVLLKAGDHRLEFDPVDQYATLSADFSNVSFYGELAADIPFVLDHWDGLSKAWKPAGDPAWVVDEHVGKLMGMPIDWGPPWGAYIYYAFIIANGTHDLTVALPYSGMPDGWTSYVPLGTTLVINALATRWVGPRTVVPTGIQRWGSIQFIEFDSSWCKDYYGLFSHETGSMAFYQCAMITGAPTGGTRAFSTIRGANANQMHSQCFYRNFQAAVDMWAGSLDLSDMAAVNCSEIIIAGDQVNITGGRNMFLRNCGLVLFCNGSSGSLHWDIFVVYFLNTQEMLFSNIGHMNMFVRGWYTVVPDPDMIPYVWFEIMDGNRLMLRGWNLEGKPPYNNQSIRMGGYGAAAQHFLSIPDLKTLHGKHYDIGHGCVVFWN